MFLNGRYFTEAAYGLSNPHALQLRSIPWLLFDIIEVENTS